MSGLRILERISSALPIARRVAAHVAPPRGRLAVAGGLSLAAAGVELLRPLALQWIVDRALIPAPQIEAAGLTAKLGADPLRAAWIGALAYAALSVARAACDWGAAIFIAEAARDFTRRLRGRLFGSLLLLSPRFFAVHRTGDLTTRLQGDVSQVGTALTESVVELAARAFLIAGTLFMLFRLDPLLAAGTLATAPIALLVVARLSRSIHTATRKARRKEGQFANQGHESLSNVALVQSLGRVDELLRGYLHASRTSARADCKAARITARLGASMELLAGLALAVALLWGSGRVIAGELSAGSLLAFLAYVRSGVKPARQSAKGSARLAKAAACGERLLEVLDSEDKIRALPGAPAAPISPSTLEFRAVTYAYPAASERALDAEGPGSGEVPRGRALDGFSWTFRGGAATLVLGPSGAGKSTLSALASRLVDPDGGAVLLDGLDLRSLDLGSLRARIAVAPQADQLFGWTIRQNLLLGRPDADDAALWRALDAVAAGDFVRSLPEGLETPLGTLGAGLSGGQRKRLCLARTLLRDAAVLVLDEPFSGLDSAAVAVLHRTIERLAETRIVIVIAHDAEVVARFLQREGLAGKEGTAGLGRTGSVDCIVELADGRARERRSAARPLPAARDAAVPTGGEAR